MDQVTHNMFILLSELCIFGTRVELIRMTKQRLSVLLLLCSPLLHPGKSLPPLHIPIWKGIQFFLFYYWSLIALQCYVNFCCTMKWISFMYNPLSLRPPSVPTPIPFRSPQSTKLGSLRYKVGFHCLDMAESGSGSVLHMEVHKKQPQSPDSFHPMSTHLFPTSAYLFLPSK